jgi:hypothetical protein
VIDRLSSRKRAGNDASEAGPGLYDAMRAELEPPTEWPADRRATVDTSTPDWRATAARIASGFQGS